MPTYQLPHYFEVRAPDLAPIMLVSSFGNSARLERHGVDNISRDHRPIVQEGSVFGGQMGQRFLVQQRIVTEEGTYEVTREAINTGQESPRFIDTAQRDLTEPPADEFAAGEAQRQEQLAYAASFNEANNYSAPYVPEIQSAPDFSYTPEQQATYEPVYSYDPGYSQTAPVYQPGTPTAPLPPDVPEFFQEPPPDTTLQEEQGLYGIDPNDYSYLDDNFVPEPNQGFYQGFESEYFV